jgi:hypothetical protein
VERDIFMRRPFWILGSIMALTLAACGDRNAGGDASTTGGAGAETGSPGMSADTAAVGAMDTAMTDTTAAGAAGADTISH